MICFCEGTRLTSSCCYHSRSCVPTLEALIIIQTFLAGLLGRWEACLFNCPVSIPNCTCLLESHSFQWSSEVNSIRWQVQVQSVSNKTAFTRFDFEYKASGFSSRNFPLKDINLFPQAVCWWLF